MYTYIYHIVHIHPHIHTIYIHTHICTRSTYTHQRRKKTKKRTVCMKKCKDKHASIVTPEAWTPAL